MGCLFSKKQEPLISHSNQEIGQTVHLFESNFNYLNPISNKQSATDGTHIYFI